MPGNTKNTRNSEGKLEKEAEKGVEKRKGFTREEAIAFMKRAEARILMANHPAHPYRCEKGGEHVPNSRFVGGIGYPRAYCWCKKCDRPYEQPMNAKERESYEELMNTRLTI